MENLKEVLIVLLVVLGLGAVIALVIWRYPYLKTDNTHATISITSSSGDAGVLTSFNGSNSTITGQEKALRATCQINLKPEEKIHIEFKCDACGEEIVQDVSEPFAEVFQCKCPIKQGKKGNAREYFSIEVSYNQEETKVTETKRKAS